MCPHLLVFLELSFWPFSFCLLSQSYSSLFVCLYLLYFSLLLFFHVCLFPRERVNGLSLDEKRSCEEVLGRVRREKTIIQNILYIESIFNNRKKMLCIKNKLTKKLSNPELAMVKTKRKECHSVLKILSRKFNYVSKHSILLRVVERKN